MSERIASDFLLTAFDSADARSLSAALAELGHASVIGDAVNDPGPACVLAAAYDESSLRAQRAAALDDPRPWAFCVPAGDRTLVAAASLAREGRMILMPPEKRELKRFIAAISDDVRESGRTKSLFSGLERCEADFSWKTRDIDVSPISRRLARLLREIGFYADRAEEDQGALALEEALVNSIEHGNLGLDSSMRPDDAASEDQYEAERDRRLADPVLGGRYIRVSIRATRDEASISIEDQGDGFDVSALDESPEGLDVSGKGYWLIKRAFDAASYNGKGNRLTLSMRRTGPGDGA